MSIKNTVLIAAGGTGGHIFPALAVADYLTKNQANIKIQWLGSNFGMETALVPKYGYTLHTVSSVGLRGKKINHLIKAPFLLFKAFFQTLKIFKKTQPKVVLAMGGFSAGITGIVAKLLGVPLIIHEQNAVAGTTNRILAKFATQTYQAFEGAFDEKINAITCGNPINFTALPKIKNSKANDLKKVLIVGGSLGAQVFNQIIPNLKTPVIIKHQTGRDNAHKVSQAYQKSINNNRVEVLEFIDNMAITYAWADVVICRAGAMTISELMLSGSCAVLIPYPYAIDDHQTANAKILSNNQAGILLPQPELNADKLDEILTNLNPNIIADMQSNAKKLAKANAAKILAGAIISHL